MTAENLDATITKYNSFVSPTADELAAVAQYVPLELLRPPMTFVTWLTVLSFARKERQDRINAVAHRISGLGSINGPSLEKDTTLLQWMHAQAVARTFISEKMDTVRDGRGRDAQAQSGQAMINNVTKF